MSLEIKLQTVPHFKGINSGKDITGGQGFGSMYFYYASDSFEKYLFYFIQSKSVEYLLEPV